MQEAITYHGSTDHGINHEKNPTKSNWVFRTHDSGIVYAIHETHLRATPRVRRFPSKSLENQAKKREQQAS